MNYLEKIYQADQDIRRSVKLRLILKYGPDSPEVLSFNSEDGFIDG